MRRSASAKRSRQRGQTIVLVAIFISVLVAMAALAIDTTTLYVAHDEVQKAADAAALAGAEAFVYSGVTTGVNSGDETDLQGLATTMAKSFVNTTVAQNKVRGTAPTVVGGAPTVDYSRLGNPQITVTLQRTNLPTFFARLFGQKLATVTASATAEAYNSSNPNPGTSPSMPPVAPSCVKPWLVPNIDFRHSSKAFVNIADGSLVSPGIWPSGGGGGGGVIGEPLGGCSGVLENLSLYNKNTISCSAQAPPTLPISLGILNGLLATPGYLPAEVASFSGPCSACAGGTPFDKAVSCCNNAQTYACGAVGPNPLIDIASGHLADILGGAECLLDPTGGGKTDGTDTISFANLQADAIGPWEITSHNSSHLPNTLVTTSSQIVTVPIVDTTALTSLLTGPKVVGFMQAFITHVDAGDGGISGFILNISGCPTSPSTPAISGGGTSPVPVRLIHN